MTAIVQGIQPRTATNAAPFVGGAILVGVLACYIATNLLYLAAGKGWDLWAATILGFPIVGALIVARRPQNTIGWVLTGGGCAIVVALLCEAIVRATLDPSDAPALWQEVLAWFRLLGFAGALPGMILALAHLFPTGHALSPRWRVAGLIVAALFLGATIETMFKPGPLEIIDGLPNLQNPFGMAWTQSILGGSLIVSIIEAAFVVLATIAVVIQRMRLARGIERLQVLWLAFAVSMTLLAGSLYVLLIVLMPDEHGFIVRLADDLFYPMATLGIPVAIGIAILRYRLYAIDRLVNRTLVYLILTALLAGFYVLLVLLLGGLLRSLSGESSSLITATSTLAAAALFRPLRSRVQRFVDRRFYRRKYDAAQLVSAFAARMTHEIDLASLDADLRGIIQDTIRPAHVSLWIRPVERT